MKTRETRARQTPTGADAEVQGFLDRYAQALTAGDAREAAATWETPAVVVGDDGVHVIAGADAVERFFAGAKAHYNQRGIVDTRAEIHRLEWLTERIALVHVRWPYLDAQGRERGDEASTYVLRRDDGGDLKTRAVIMRGASRAE